MPLSVRVAVPNFLKCVGKFSTRGTLEAGRSELPTAAEEMTSHGGGTESKCCGQRRSCQSPALREELQYLDFTVSEPTSDA